MSAKTTSETRAPTRSSRPNPLTGFLAVMYYEFLWNLRKKKTIGVFLLIFIIATLFLALPPILANYRGSTIQSNPDYVLDQATTLNGLFQFLLAVAISMNTISGEFETGTIVPLLTKPISRSTIFLGKLAAAFITLLAAYTLFAIYYTIGGSIIYGPQNNLGLLPVGVVGLTLATMVWISVTLTLGSLSKSSLVAALGSFGVYLGLTIVTTIVATFLGQTSFLFYTPGDGATASTGDCTGGSRFGDSDFFATGTNQLGNIWTRWILNGGQTVNFCGIRIRAQGTVTELFTSTSSTVAGVATQATMVAAAYILLLLFVGWLAFWKAQIKE